MPRRAFFGQRTGQGVPIGETSEALLEKSDEFIDMKGLPFFSQYLNREINERLTSSSPSVYEDRFGLRFSLELPDSTQLIIKLKFKDLKKDFFEILFFHERASYGIKNAYQ